MSAADGTMEFEDMLIKLATENGSDLYLATGAVPSIKFNGVLTPIQEHPMELGQVAEIAKRDIWSAEQMAEARPDIDYEIVALDTVMFTEPDRIRDLLTEVSDGLADGPGNCWAPLPAEIYPLTEARAAFRRMQQARHIGKIVLQWA